MKFNKLKIQSVRHITKDAVEVTFEVPADLEKEYSFTAGQHISLDFFLERNKYRRTYSICSSPTENKLAICVKRQHLGIISNYINDAFFKGFSVDVSIPFGNFFEDKEIKNSKGVFLWAGGSGITPMISIAKYLLHTKQNIKVNLIYANKNEASIIFLNEIIELEKNYSNVFKVHYILSHPNSNSFLEKIFSRKSQLNKYSEGFLNHHLIEDITTEKSIHFICGPQGMMTVCEQSLLQLNTPKESIKVEHFVGSNSVANSNKNALLLVKINGIENQIQIESKTLLEAMLSNNIEPPYACKSGTCGTCKATLISGEVIMARDFALNEADRASNKILCCQSWPKTDKIELRF